MKTLNQSNPIRWGILGTGRIAHDFATAVQETDGASLVAIASRNLEKAVAFGREFQVETCFGSYQDLADADGIDAIYVATPHPMHVSNTLMALNGGKAVLCEKPLTINRSEADHIVQLARAKGLFLMEAMWSRFLPSMTTVKDIIDSGEIGHVHQLSADFGFRATVDPSHRLNSKELGGGALLDLGIYPLSLAAYLMGPIVAAHAQAELGPTGVDTNTAFTLRHQNATISTGSCSLVANTPRELIVSGELGYLRVHAPFHHSTSLDVVLANGPSRTVQTPYLGNGFTYEIAEAMRCMRAGLIESPRMPHAESLALMGWLDTMREQIGLRYHADVANDW